MARWVMILAMLCVAPALAAQERGFSALARVDAEKSVVRDTRLGLELHLSLSQGVPYRVFTLDDPARLVLDFREIDWQGLSGAEFTRAERATGVRVGQIRPGWSRMVIDLAGPHVLDSAGLAVERVTGAGDLHVVLGAPDAEAFAAQAGTPDLPGWDLPDPEGALVAPRRRVPGEGPLFVVLDPGHGGIDPGAQVGGVTEKDLMLQFALELKEVLLRDGRFDVVLTRDADEFVPLERRVALAHQGRADVFLSLHADALSGARAHGASVYTLSDSASDEASAALAERHNRADILAGVDLSGKDDVVADVLIDLARQETQPRAERLAKAVLATFKAQDLPLLSRPGRHAGFSVLKAPDIPSVLLELGFLSSPRDLENLRDAAWRARMAGALRDAMLVWRREDGARAGLVRQ
ncbi:N-acetylmuramoyl-L-alanine amidase [Roseovarius sp.]|uniref:N-acetylmuramoyl-L-alanine amidase n=1 Tax=Roseovarius sp. TaxID=1486281 RepID=UPI0026079870|nr:N-acetylmuramoyl-L-alanine amidase [Roseovarius sp.]